MDVRELMTDDPDELRAIIAGLRAKLHGYDRALFDLTARTADLPPESQAAFKEAITSPLALKADIEAEELREEGRREAKANGKPRSEFAPFEAARAYVRELGLRSQRKWKKWRKTSRPAWIPTHPNSTYKDQWVDLGDWLGTGATATQNRTFMTADQAHWFMLGCPATTFEEWAQLSKDGLRPENVPYNFSRTYGQEECQKRGGWAGLLGGKGQSQAEAPWQVCLIEILKHSIVQKEWDKSDYRKSVNGMAGSSLTRRYIPSWPPKELREAFQEWWNSKPAPAPAARKKKVSKKKPVK